MIEILTQLYVENHRNSKGSTLCTTYENHTKANINEHLIKSRSALDLPFYDPLMIVEKTNGRMAEDQFWLKIERKIVHD